MGGNPWHYFYPYQVDINTALARLKEQEFRAGRYGFDYWFNQISGILDTTNPRVSSILEQASEVINQPEPSVEELIAKYGSVQAAITAIVEATEADGTQSILDMTHISIQPECGTVCPLTENELQKIFQTTKPTRQTIEALLLNQAEIEDWEPFEIFWESIDRGQGRYIVVYREEQPLELFFAGYSYD